jgi:hypothetical protein
MDAQTTIDYYKLFGELVMRVGHLTQQRDEIDVEITKVRQLIVATFPLIPADKQRLFEKEIASMDEQAMGLLDAIRLIFSTHKGEWLTVTQVRDYLMGTGFDFRHYRANPLASIATTLKRMVPAYLDSMNSGSGTLFQLRKTIGDRIAEAFDTKPLPGSPGVTLPNEDDIAREKANRIARIKAATDRK